MSADASPSVFVNCPFDDEYRPLFRALMFAIYACGFTVRCALEEEDASEVRIGKIYQLISKCEFGIHDLSRTELDGRHQLPRFNMPLELGVFLGAKHFGQRSQRAKKCLILDREQYRYQKFISDIAGQDIRSHQDEPRRIVEVARDWLRSAAKKPLPGGKHIWHQYELFQMELPVLCDVGYLDHGNLTYNDYAQTVTGWLSAR